MSEISSMEHVMDELDVLEATETDAVLLRDLLEELEDEETMNKDEDNENNCLMQSVWLTTLVKMCLKSGPLSGMISLSTTMVGLRREDWLLVVGVVEFEYCNNIISDYSYLSNEMTCSCLWEEDS